MALKEEFIREGNWLFRWRSYLPLILFIVVLAGLKSTNSGPRTGFDRGWEVACLLISILGLAVRIYTVGYAARHTSGRNTRKQVAEALNSTGIYSLMRHPLYFGNFLIGLGISLFPQIWWVPVIYILTFWVYYERIMFAEENFLFEKFGKTFEAWSQNTPPFWPKFSNWQRPEDGFSVKASLKGEYPSFFSIILTFTFLDVMRYVLGQGRFKIDGLWLILFIAGLLFYGSVRFLKKKTKVLSEQS